MANRWGSNGNRLYFLGLKITADGDCSHEIKRRWKKSYDQPGQHIKKQRHHFANKGPYSQSYGFSNSHVWMWELNHKEGWAPKSWCFWTVVLEKTLDNPLDCKEIQPVHPKGNQSWIFIRRTDAEAEALILWPPHVKSWLIGKDPNAGKDWGQEEKGMTEDEMVEWHHPLKGHEFEQTQRRWRTGKCGVLRSMELQSVGHNWMIGQQQCLPVLGSRVTQLYIYVYLLFFKFLSH